ncbi:MAG: hypothetical protein K5787_07100 [Lentisphaeria bacterium]|nr:hypothetical protein [Lentisphaeria bacterium]
MAKTINYANVNISLQQFQDISRGEFNAGEVKLVGENKLAKMNHHVHKLGKNNETISHAQVIAIKEALIKALSQNGVGSEELDKSAENSASRLTVSSIAVLRSAACGRSRASKSARYSTATPPS